MGGGLAVVATSPRDASLCLTEPSLRLCGSLLARWALGGWVVGGLGPRYPVSGKERSSLLPAGERGAGLALSGEGGRSMGRLGGGVTQVPATPPAPASGMGREQLPIFSHRSSLLAGLASSQVVLVTGDTGSGKTTQVPQFILEEAAGTGQAVRVAVCEPRRLAAVTVAERVAAERGEKVGGTVGYQIRLESCVSPRTCLTFCTYGVLLRR